MIEKTAVPGSVPGVTSLESNTPLMGSRNYWTLNKILVLLLTAGFLTLVVDLRSEHVDVVRHHWTAWIPIVYSGIMVVLGALGLAFWGRGGRQMLTVAFSAGFVVGVLGFWFHNGGHLILAVSTVLSAWTQRLHHEDVPPQLAPLAFLAMGLLGMLACARRFQPLTAQEPLRPAEPAAVAGG